MAPRPVQRTPKATSVLLTAVAGVLGGILVFAIVANLVGSGADKPDSAAATFDVGPAEERARTIASGGPILFQDLLGSSRDIYVHHLGGDEWRAFEAHSPGAPRRCFLEWRTPAGEFVDACDGRTFPADGAGLVSYAAQVDDRRHVIVDLRQPVSASSSTTTPTTATTTTTTTPTTTTAAATATTVSEPDTTVAPPAG
ncbi:MAG TPA: hypothetical protein VM942_09760 [Acidimicrobiales bacterium]|nr:hypothetical protein [Acidimicrobiales bacterium]